MLVISTQVQPSTSTGLPPATLWHLKQQAEMLLYLTAHTGITPLPLAVVLLQTKQLLLTV